MSFKQRLPLSTRPKCLQVVKPPVIILIRTASLFFSPYVSQQKTERSRQSSALKNYKINSGTSSTRSNANPWRSSIEQEWSAPWWSLWSKKSTIQLSHQKENHSCGSSSHTLCHRRRHQIGLFWRFKSQRWAQTPFKVSAIKTLAYQCCWLWQQVCDSHSIYSSVAPKIESEEQNPGIFLCSVSWTPKVPQSSHVHWEWIRNGWLWWR